MAQVLWAALFALAVLVREGSAPHSLALRSTAAAGMLPLLQSCMAAYKVWAGIPSCCCTPRHHIRDDRDDANVDGHYVLRASFFILYEPSVERGQHEHG